MAISVKVKSDTAKWDAMMRNVRAVGAKQVGVGVFGDAELAKIAETHEYGEKTWHASGEGVPERSYIRSTLREKRDVIRRKMNQVASAYFAGKLEATQAVGLLGEFVASAVKAKIRSNIPPKLKPETVKRKGSSKALIDTGRLLNSIQSRLVK